MSNWEARNEGHALRLLVGDHFGDRPEDGLEAIRSAKKQRAAWLCRKMGLDKESVVLEIGSGMGLTSKHVAAEVQHLYCSDISTSFLEIARKECAGIPNIDFVKIEKEPAVFDFRDEFFDAIFADAVFIHLNLYDIYWYFAEFQRLAKKGGRVFIDIMNASRMDASKFSQMAELYRKDRNSLKRLLCWNSVDAVVTIASTFGFRLESNGSGRGLLRGANANLRWGRLRAPTANLLFSKR